MIGARVALFVIFGMGAMYFLLKKRRFDFFSLAFFSAGVYFLPGFFGYAQYPIAYGDRISRELYAETYVVMCAVLGAIFLAALFYDMVPHRINYSIGLRGTRWTGVLALVVASFGLLMTVATTGMALLSPEKSEMLARLNRWIILWQVGAALAAVCFAERRRWGLFACALPLLAADVYIGVRVSAALAFMSIFIAYSESRGRQRFFTSQKRFVAVAAIAFSFFLLYKFLFVYVKEGDWDEVTRQLSNRDLYVNSVVHSEPFTTQVILDEVLLTGFRVGPDHLSSVGWQFVFFAPSLGATVISFNDLFQARLFPHAIGWGMANNIWAEMWSSGGWGMLAGFIVVFVVVLGIASRAMRIDNPEIRAVAALLFSYWAFYFHRNDVVTQLGLMKRVAVIAAACLIGSMVVQDVTHRIRGRLTRRMAREAGAASD